MAKDNAKTQKPRMAKVAMSLPRSLVDDLDAEMRRVVSLIPPNPTPADLLRMRGESEAFVRERIANAARLTDDLFAAVPSPAPACTCTVTPFERQEDPACPVHFPGGRS